MLQLYNVIRLTTWGVVEQHRCWKVGKFSQANGQDTVVISHCTVEHNLFYFFVSKRYNHTIVPKMAKTSWWELRHFKPKSKDSQSKPTILIRAPPSEISTLNYSFFQYPNQGFSMNGTYKWKIIEGITLTAMESSLVKGPLTIIV